MPTRMVKHKGHEHLVKETNEEIFGLKIDDRGLDRVSEAFGWSDEQFDKVIDALKKFDKFQDAVEAMNEDLPVGTKISVLADFLKSDSFKKLAVKIEKPNDYFMLSMIWTSCILHKRDHEDGLPIGGKMELLKLLEELPKK